MDFRTFFTQNTFWGKLLGAFFGYLMAGPAGALFGILIGNFFDKGLTKHFNNPYFEIHSKRHTQSYDLFLKTTFMVMGYIAKSDGRVSEKDIDYAKQLMGELGLTRNQVVDAKAYFNIGKSQDFDLFTVLLPFKIFCKSDHSLITHFLNIQYQTTVHDGLTYKKARALNEVFRFLGFAPVDIPFHAHQEAPFSSHYQNRQPPPSPYANFSLSQAYTLLNIDQQATKAAVKQAYRRLISRNHPDKLVSQGKSDHEIKLANEKTQKIRKAYEVICEARGW